MQSMGSGVLFGKIEYLHERILADSWWVRQVRICNYLPQLFFYSASQPIPSPYLYLSIAHIACRETPNYSHISPCKLILKAFRLEILLTSFAKHISTLVHSSNYAARDG